MRHSPGQLPDIMATVLELAGATYPSIHDSNEILPLEGTSLAPLFTQDKRERGPLFWEHEGNAAVRLGQWKLVRRYPEPWELYDMKSDRTELNDLAPEQPDRVAEMSESYESWAERSAVIPREKILELMKTLEGNAFWEEEERDGARDVGQGAREKER